MIGYKQDYYASQELMQQSSSAAQRYQVAEPQGISYLPFLPPIRGLDGTRVAILTDPSGEADLEQRIANLESQGRSLSEDAKLERLARWWEQAEPHAETDRPLVTSARLHGGRMALRWTAIVPFAMAIGFGLLFLYFKAQGGYRAIDLRSHAPAE